MKKKNDIGIEIGIGIDSCTKVINNINNIFNVYVNKSEIKIKKVRTFFS